MIIVATHYFSNLLTLNESAQNILIICYRFPLGPLHDQTLRKLWTFWWAFIKNEQLIFKLNWGVWEGQMTWGPQIKFHFGPALYRPRLVLDLKLTQTKERVTRAPWWSSPELSCSGSDEGPALIRNTAAESETLLPSTGHSTEWLQWYLFKLKYSL